MPTGNQYGIDYENILSTESAIKTARLRQGAAEQEREQKEAGKALRENALRTQMGLGNVLTPEQEIKYKAAAPKVAKDIAETAMQQQQKQALSQYYQKRGKSKEESELLANGYAQDLMNFDKEYRAKNEDERIQVRNFIAQQGRSVQNLLGVAKENPQQAETMYQDYLKGVNDNIKELYKTGQNDIADKLQESIDKAPPTLLNQDGSFNAEFPMLSLSKMSAMMQTADLYDTQIKAQGKTGTSSSEFERLARALQNPNLDTNTRKLYEARIQKLSQPDMSSLKINAETVKNAQTEFAMKMGLKDPFQLSTADTSKWTPEQRAEGNQLASIIVKGLGANAKEADKKILEYNSMADQMQNSINAFDEVGEFRLLDETTKKYFSNYFGLSEKEMQSTEAVQALQSMMNLKLKADSGASVTGNELDRAILETATPNMTKTKILMGIKNIAKRSKGSLGGLKKVMGQTAFNLKYGSVLKSYDDIIKSVDQRLKKKDTSKKTRSEELAKLREQKQSQTATPTRQDVFNQIKSSRTNATDEQINAYLDSKGY